MSVSEPWRIGVLFSQSGHLSNIERTQLMGTMVAIEQINDEGGINGRALVPVCYDPASDNSLFRHYSKRLLIEDGIATIFGCYASSSRKAVLPIIERMNGLLWYPTLYEGYEFSPNVIYTGSSPNQNSVALAEYLTEHCGDRIYFVGADYVFPCESNRIMRHLLQARGRKIVGEKYVPIRAKREDFVPILNDIKNLQPDAVFSTVVGDATTLFYQMYRRSGILPDRTPIFSLTTTETENRAMGSDASEGHYTVASYFQTVESADNAEFVRRIKRKFGDDLCTNVCMEAAYYQVHLFKAALEMVDTLETDVLRPAVLGAGFSAPQGAVGIDALWGHGNVWSRVGRASNSGQFDIVAQSRAAIETDPFFMRSGATA